MGVFTSWYVHVYYLLLGIIITCYALLYYWLWTCLFPARLFTTITNDLGCDSVDLLVPLLSTSESYCSVPSTVSLAGLRGCARSLNHKTIGMCCCRLKIQAEPPGEKNMDTTSKNT